MLPMAGCDRELLEAVVEAADLLGLNEHQVSIAGLGKVEANLDADATDRFCRWLVESNWIKRLERSKREPFLAAIRSGEWMQ